MLLLRLDAVSPARNLATEERLFDTASEGSVIVGTYRNHRCVVFGKHQNPWREIDLSVAREERVPLFRRMTGGGTVFHDAGNLVFTVMGPRRHVDRARNLEIVTHALSECGIDAVLGDGFDLLVEGRKISGSAFRFRRNTAIHHGTLLFQSDRTLMHRLLKSEEEAISTKAVASRPARTANVAEMGCECGLDELRLGIERAFIRELGPDSVESVDVEAHLPAVDEIERRHSEWEWVFGRTPRFDFTLETEAGAKFVLEVVKGRVLSVNGENSDLTGCRLIREEMLHRQLTAELREAVESSTLL